MVSDGQSSDLPDSVRQRGCRGDAQNCSSGFSSLALPVEPDAVDLQLARRCNVVEPTIGYMDPVSGGNSGHALEVLEVGRSRLVRAHPLRGDHRIERLLK